MFSFDEAFKKSVDYFDGDELSAKVFFDKYALKDKNGNLLEETPEDMHRRLAQEFARIEKSKFSNPLSYEEIFNLIDGFKYVIPQGSQMFGIGNDDQVVSLSNCYVVETPEDSYGGILKTDQQLVQISKRRGGVGVDISKLRPNGAATKNAARSSTGIVSWMERFSNSIKEVGQSGRRGALMITLNVAHPDIEEFVNIKNDETKVTGANISVKLTDEFLNAVRNEEKFTLRWPIDSDSPSITKEIEAKDLWDKIIHSAWFRAEPGLLFWDNIINNNAVDCYADEGFETISTNPCSELPLCEFDSCRLLVQNLFSYVKNPFTDKAKFDFGLFYEHGRLAQRLMDDVIDLEIEKIDKIIKKVKSDPENKDIKAEELYIWKAIKDKCVKGRRTGLGITATGDTIAAMGLKYGSEESIELIEKIHRTQKHASFESSADMSKELGPFPIWNWEKEKDSKFLLQIKEENAGLYNKIKKYGRRNIANLTIAPTGSVSLLTRTTSGIEPLFMLDPYIRRKKVNPNDNESKIDFVDDNGDSWQEFKVYHPKVKLWMEVTGESDLTKSPWYGCCAQDIDWKMRVKLQAAAQKHIDHAISSTINLPEDVKEEKVAEIYKEAWLSNCKGITVYRDNCRSGVLVSSKKEKKENTIQKTHAPKRPKELECDVYHTTAKGEDFFVLVGLWEDGSPYEVFAGKNGMVKKSIKKGVIKKVKRGHYKAIFENGDVMDNITDNIEDDYESITRLCSTSLRHGCDIGFVVHQLEKVKGTMFSFSKAVSRMLKKYIQDGTKVHGSECPNCGSDSLERREGCVTCMSCGFSKCS